MDRFMIDVQEQQENRELFLQWVGIRGHKHTLLVDGFQTIADADIYVSLGETKRAIHMSRLVELVQSTWQCSRERLDHLMDQAMEVMQSSHAKLEMRFPFLLQKKSPITGLAGEVAYDCAVHCTKELGKELVVQYQVSVPVCAVCPCSKAISRHGAHNQRGYVSILAQVQEQVRLSQLIRCAEQGASAEVFSVVKRPDEKFITETGYENAKFVEDMARDIALKLRQVEGVSHFTVEVENMESIHNHNAYAFYDSRSGQ